jgi:hypothetical protein
MRARKVLLLSCLYPLFLLFVIGYTFTYSEHKALYSSQKIHIPSFNLSSLPQVPVTMLFPTRTPVQEQSGITVQPSTAMTATPTASPSAQPAEVKVSSESGREEQIVSKEQARDDANLDRAQGVIENVSAAKSVIINESESSTTIIRSRSSSIIDEAKQELRQQLDRNPQCLSDDFC